MEQNLELNTTPVPEAGPPQETLQRLLSTKSAISTASSFARSRQAAIGTKTSFREIGTGSTGKVFEKPGTPWAFKVPLVDGQTKLWNNYLMHLRIQESFDTLGEVAGLVEVPRVSWFANADSSFWDENLELFPDQPTFPRRPREIMCMERVFPLPEVVRNCLIDLFCNPAIALEAKREPKNTDCLIRLFFGRRRYGAYRPGGSRFFSFRNFKLHLDQIEMVLNNAEMYARGMADALAVLHWHTQIDAFDVEFVLGSTPLDRNGARRMLPFRQVEELPPGSSTYENATNVDQNYRKRAVSLWLIDFDACNAITMNDAGVRQAVDAFLKTDPFCPRPNTLDKYAGRLWDVFSEQYIATGRRLIKKKKLQGLPAKFIEKIEQKLSDSVVQALEVVHRIRIKR
uniref:OxaJ n=1 Tax=Penicillium oxalicum TaxID=69781 RepID=A0A1B2TT32_PENOX|nr:OxaJ [Penicillium oxalicum]